MTSRPVFDCGDLERILDVLARPDRGEEETLETVAMRWHLSVCPRCHRLVNSSLADPVDYCEALSDLPLALATLDLDVREQIAAGRPPARRARLERLCEEADAVRARLLANHAARCPMCNSWLEMIRAGFDPAHLPEDSSQGPNPWPTVAVVLILIAWAGWVATRQLPAKPAPIPSPSAAPSDPAGEGSPEGLLLRELTRLEQKLREQGAAAAGAQQRALLGSAEATRLSLIAAIERWAMSSVRDRLRTAPAPWQQQVADTLDDLLDRAPAPPGRVPDPPSGAGPPVPGPLEGQHELRELVLQQTTPEELEESEERRASYELEVRKWALEEHYLRLHEQPPPKGSWQERAMRELGELVRPPVTADNTPIPPGRG